MDSYWEILGLYRLIKALRRYVLMHIIPYTASIVHIIRTDKKENKISLIFKEIQSGAVAKSYMKKESANISPYMYEEAVKHI
jgi:hypothetical protein